MPRRLTLLDQIHELPEHHIKNQLLRAHICFVSLVRDAGSQIKGVADFNDLQTFKRQTREDCLQMGALMADIAKVLG